MGSSVSDRLMMQSENKSDTAECAPWWKELSPAFIKKGMVSQLSMQTGWGYSLQQSPGCHKFIPGKQADQIHSGRDSTTSYAAGLNAVQVVTPYQPHPMSTLTPCCLPIPSVWRRVGGFNASILYSTQFPVSLPETGSKSPLQHACPHPTL